MRGKRSFVKKQGPVRSNKSEKDGITFSSGLEVYCYEQLKEHGIYEGYENEKFHLITSFTFENESYERQANGKGDLKNRNGNVRGISYTPDFCGTDFIIETKGRANETFPLRYKLFKLWLTNNKDKRTLYKPQTKKEVDEVVKLIKSKR